MITLTTQATTFQLTRLAREYPARLDFQQALQRNRNDLNKLLSSMPTPPDAKGRKPPQDQSRD